MNNGTNTVTNEEYSHVEGVLKGYLEDLNNAIVEVCKARHGASDLEKVRSAVEAIDKYIDAGSGIIKEARISGDEKISKLIDDTVNAIKGKLSSLKKDREYNDTDLDVDKEVNNLKAVKKGNELKEFDLLTSQYTIPDIDKRINDSKEKMEKLKREKIYMKRINESHIQGASFIEKDFEDSEIFLNITSDVFKRNVTPEHLDELIGEIKSINFNAIDYSPSDADKKLINEFRSLLNSFPDGCETIKKIKESIIDNFDNDGSFKGKKGFDFENIVEGFDSSKAVDEFVDKYKEIFKEHFSNYFFKYEGFEIPENMENMDDLKSVLTQAKEIYDKCAKSPQNYKKSIIEIFKNYKNTDNGKILDAQYDAEKIIYNNLKRYAEEFQKLSEGLSKNIEIDGRKIDIEDIDNFDVDDEEKINDILRKYKSPAYPIVGSKHQNIFSRIGNLFFRKRREAKEAKADGELKSKIKNAITSTKSENARILAERREEFSKKFPTISEEEIEQAKRDERKRIIEGTSDARTAQRNFMEENGRKLDVRTHDYDDER